MSRREELERNLHAVRERIARACDKADRARDEVKLLAVTKHFPAEDVATLIDIGLTDFAENKDQEAAAKAPEVAALRPDAKPRWHMVGNLQSNKARSVAAWAQEVQSLDRTKIANALAKAVAQAERPPLDVLIQVSLDGDPARGGCPIASVPELANVVTQRGELRLRGFMTVAPLHSDVNAMFGRFAELTERLRHEHPGAVEISAGMSGDMEQAIAHGATCVRVGTALLGSRPIASPGKE